MLKFPDKASKTSPRQKRLSNEDRTDPQDRRAGCKTNEIGSQNLAAYGIFSRVSDSEFNSKSPR